MKLEAFFGHWERLLRKRYYPRILALMLGVVAILLALNPVLSQLMG
jgi:hypothetical protein